MGQETGDMRHATWDRGHGTGDMGQETWDMGQETWDCNCMNQKIIQSSHAFLHPRLRLGWSRVNLESVTV